MLKIKQTAAKRKFKQRFGQQNHFLVTTLIGLDYIEKGDIECPESFSTSWNPRDKIHSARRSRDFILQSFLSYAVDGLDMYISMINREPRYCFDKEIENAICSAERSVYKKLENLSNYISLDTLLLSMCFLLITLRNNITHVLAENKITEKYINILLENKETIKELFRGLDIELLIKKNETKNPIDFKEAASLINATHKIIEQIDFKILERADEDYFEKTLIWTLKNNSNLRKKYQKFDNTKKEHFIKTIFQNLYAITNDEVVISGDMLNISKEKIG